MQTPRPIQALGPHVSPLGVAYWGKGPQSLPWPAQYEGTVFVAQHGCAVWLPAQACLPAGVGRSGEPTWAHVALHTSLPFLPLLHRPLRSAFNSTPPLGYRIANVALAPDGRTAAAHTLFAEGWIDEDGEFWGRPTGLLRLPDGSMLVADDYANTVYRIAYDGPASPAPAPSAGCRRDGMAAAAVAAALAAAALSLL